MDLFKRVVPEQRQHPIFTMMLADCYAPERAVLQEWAQGFIDRDGKFVKEFQLSFESALWELYLFAVMKEVKLSVDFTRNAPDFVIHGAHPFGLEATISAPAAGEKPAYGYSPQDVLNIPEDFTQFNVDATLRFCNSFSAKVKRYREYYAGLEHMAGKPFVVGIASFDRPLAHFAAARPAFAALYGLYHDEAATPRDATEVVSYNVSEVPKNEKVSIDLAMFCDESYADVAAVMYTSLATWGKVRALARNPEAKTVYTTFHKHEGGLLPEVRRRWKRDYSEHLMDGLMVMHNPFAKTPLPKSVFAHPRIAQMVADADGELITDAPTDFLLLRQLFSITESAE